ncbi:hypothetical protein M405DRAFT_862951 [Rhizopogon salebrosus TDB-379]|nr:hypothetical protein M405DRAFT_862951 [Rhizopogon salebrosus TDB-379]
MCAKDRSSKNTCTNYPVFTTSTNHPVLTSPKPIASITPTRTHAHNPTLAHAPRTVPARIHLPTAPSLLCTGHQRVEPGDRPQGHSYTDRPKNGHSYTDCPKNSRRTPASSTNIAPSATPVSFRTRLSTWWPVHAAHSARLFQQEYAYQTKRAVKPTIQRPSHTLTHLLIGSSTHILHIASCVDVVVRLLIRVSRLD